MMRYFLTDAPSAYDYGYTVELSEHCANLTGFGVPRILRLVQIEDLDDGAIDHQTGRYQSGLYVFVEVKLTPDRDSNLTDHVRFV